MDMDINRNEINSQFERRIHFSLKTVAANQRAVTTVDFETSTGRIINAEILVDPAAAKETTAVDFLKLVGFAVGLEAALPGDKSMMAQDSKVSAPTADDEKALCRLYGTPNYCGD